MCGMPYHQVTVVIDLTETSIEEDSTSSMVIDLTISDVDDLAMTSINSTDHARQNQDHQPAENGACYRFFHLPSPQQLGQYSMTMTQLVVPSDMLSRTTNAPKLRKLCLPLPNATREYVACYISGIQKNSSDKHVVAIANTKEGLLACLKAVAKPSGNKSTGTRRDKRQCTILGSSQPCQSGGAGVISSEAQRAMTLVALDRRAGYYCLGQDGGIIEYVSEDDFTSLLGNASNNAISCVEATAPHPAASVPGHGISFKAEAARDMTSGKIFIEYSAGASVFLSHEEDNDVKGTACLRDYEYEQRLYSNKTDETFTVVFSGNPLRNLATRINDARNLPGGANCEFLSYLHVPPLGSGKNARMVVVLRLTRDVRRGEELLVSYGSSTFWDIMDRHSRERMNMKDNMMKSFKDFMQQEWNSFDMSIFNEF